MRLAMLCLLVYVCYTVRNQTGLVPNGAADIH